MIYEKFYFYVPRNEYLQNMDYKRQILNLKFRLVLLLLIVFLAVYIVLLMAIDIVTGKTENASDDALGIFAIGGVMLPLLIYLIYVICFRIKSFGDVGDIWISDEGINMPLPFDKEGKKFIYFNEIDKIVIYKNLANPYLSHIQFHLKTRFKPQFLFTPYNMVSISYIDVNKFIDAVKRATRNKIKIEISLWGSCAHQLS